MLGKLKLIGNILSGKLENIYRNNFRRKILLGSEPIY